MLWKQAQVVVTVTLLYVCVLVCCGAHCWKFLIMVILCLILLVWLLYGDFLLCGNSGTFYCPFGDSSSFGYFGASLRFFYFRSFMFIFSLRGWFCWFLCPCAAFVLFCSTVVLQWQLWLCIFLCSNIYFSSLWCFSLFFGCVVASHAGLVALQLFAVLMVLCRFSHFDHFSSTLNVSLSLFGQVQSFFYISSSLSLLHLSRPPKGPDDQSPVDASSTLKKGGGGVICQHFLIPSRLHSSGNAAIK